ncbi:hypothetical protein [Halorubrum trapanicum]|uniref:hypothetical protein n=1 Tax=Halorubrum trapanicum TaxID=29284 RepID=UPI0012FD128A|nr:hypothetical protein [Halorubrum trapanicum]
MDTDGAGVCRDRALALTAGRGLDVSVAVDEHDDGTIIEVEHDSEAWTLTFDE